MNKTFIITDLNHLNELKERDQIESGELYIEDRSKCIFGQESFVLVDSVYYRFVVLETHDYKIVSEFPIIATEYSHC